MKELLLDEPVAVSLHEIALTVGGEVDGDAILCASPGRPPDDRSCRVRIDPTNSNSVFVYYCEGPAGQVYARIRALLGIEDSPRSLLEALRRREAAQRIWEETSPASNTPVESYLRSRGITLPVPPDIRFHPSLHYERSRFYPAMVSAVTNEAGQIVAVHRTYLSRELASKADVFSQKKTLGPVAGCAIRLSKPLHTVALAEGIETALSVLQETGIPTWSALSCNGLRSINLPKRISRVIVAADNGAPGHAAAKAAIRRFRAQGRVASIVYPQLKDFNDDLMEELRVRNLR